MGAEASNGLMMVALNDDERSGQVVGTKYYCTPPVASDFKDLPEGKQKNK